MAHEIPVKLEIGLVNLVTGLATAAGNRFYPAEKVPSKAQTPYITYQEITNLGHVDINFDYPRYQIATWDPRKIDAKNLAAVLFKELHLYKGTLNGVVVKSITKMDSPGTLFDREAGEDGAGVYYVPQDFKIIYKGE